MINVLRLLLLPLVLSLSACLQDPGSTDLSAMPVNAKTTPDNFIRFTNTQASLAAGDYVIVAATVNPGESGDFILTINYDDGSTEIRQGSWGNSGGIVSADGNGNPRFLISLTQAGGLTLTLDSTVDNYLFLLRNEQIIATNDNAGSSSNAQIQLLTSKISSKAYANAYYAAVDPNNERTTLADWKTLNGFDNGADVEVIFRDPKDLGYGRVMHARTRADGGVAIFVSNYVVELAPGDATDYGPLNLDAAIHKEDKYHIGSNAIEFGPIDQNDPGSEKIAKFFIFAPADPSGVHHRLTTANLDGRGLKPVPTTCMACHGNGELLPLNQDGTFATASLKSGKIHLLEAETFEYSDQSGLRESDQHDAIRQINQMAHDSFVEMGSRAEINGEAKWYNGFATDLLSGAYADDFANGSLQENFIPAGWRATANRPDGVETLYLQVVKPHCIACHSLLGSTVAENVPAVIVDNESVRMNNAINFSSYEKFMHYNDLTIDFVYKQGRMPSALLNYSQFWKNPEGAPTLLATFLNGFDVFDADGKVVEPGSPQPKPGADRTLTSPAFLDATGSPFVENFNWSIVSVPAGAQASLTQASEAATSLIADTDGDYVLQLLGSNSLASSEPKQVVITIDSSLTPSPDQLNFVTDVRGVISAKGCAGCHAETTSYTGIPLILGDSNANLYRDVLTKVDFNNPEDSMLLRKLTSLQHTNFSKLDRSNATDNANYLVLLNWIRNGAPCGTSAIYCDFSN